MTKRVRIENADNDDHRVVVEVWQRSNDGQPDVLVESNSASRPTDMVTAYVHSQRYLIVREAG